MGQTQTTTRVLADFVASVEYDSLPEELVRRVTRQALDLVGVALAGSEEPAAQAVRRLVDSTSDAPADRGRATIWGTGRSASAADAAFVNATAAHALDFDDMWLPGAHPSAPILPAAVAVAEARGRSGRDLIAAQVAGYEVMGRLHSAVSGRFGWHPTSVFGTFGAAAACSRLLGLSGQQTVAAFGIASSMASGIDGHAGTMTKPLHAGLAANSGVRAALLAADGFTASEFAFDGKHSFFESFFKSTPAQSWRLTADLGRSYYLLNPGIGIKMYPAGYYMHQTFEAALQIVVDNDLTVEDVAAIRIATVGSRFDRPFPTSVLDAKFSLQYMATMAVLFRRLTIDRFDAEVVFSPEARALLSRIQTYVEPDLPANPDIANNPVTVRCVDGREFTVTVTTPRSHWRYPLSREAWIEKFRQNAASVVDEATAATLIETFDHLEAVTDIGSVVRLLRR